MPIVSEIDRLMPEGSLAVPDHRTAKAKAEWDWYYRLAPADRKRVLRFCKPGGIEPDVCASFAGYEYVDEWADDLVSAVVTDRRQLADDGWDTERTLEAAEALVGPVEIGELCGVKTNTVHQWVTRRILPPPWATVSGTPIWPRADIEQWATDTGRLAPLTETF